MTTSIPHPRNAGPTVPESPEQSETKVRMRGYPIVFKFHEHPSAHFPSHYHKKATTNYIIQGHLELSFPDNSELGVKKLSVGDRIDIPANEPYEIQVGVDGCDYLVGSI